MNKLQFFKKYKYVALTVFPVIYVGVLRYLIGLIFKNGAPTFVVAPVIAVFSLVITFLCLFSIKDTSKSNKYTIFATLYISPALIWFLISRVAYIWNSYLDGNFFISLSIYFSALDNALWSLGFSTASLITVILYKFFMGGKNEDPRGNKK